MNPKLKDKWYSVMDIKLIINFYIVLFLCVSQ